MSQARSLEPWRWLGIPMVQVLAATILFGVPLRIWGLRLPEPIFPLAVVFAWAVIRPSMIAPFLVLAMGFFLDLYWGGPLGLWALCLLIAYGVVLAARPIMAGQSRTILWAWYALVVATGHAGGLSVRDAGREESARPDPHAVAIPRHNHPLSLRTSAHRHVRRRRRQVPVGGAG
ncbi:hypothetical protein [Phenylobacterium sp. J367]|uniref:hypothetical protein n=1 Tax=Phenylobacterium sp. J367 TaxID=2898435 RepID=UPI0021513C29|nr:hypothetical protein [Phenylobacterium sp. J367]MCR5880959.1 hypothetical protein [Phenylobacterium sp. J367]